MVSIYKQKVRELPEQRFVLLLLNHPASLLCVDFILYV